MSYLAVFVKFMAPPLCGLATIAALDVGAGGEKVQELLFQDETGMRTISADAKPLRHAATAPSFSRASAGTGLYPKPYANDQQNSRLSATVSSGFRVRWQSQLNPTFQPEFVLTDASRIVVQSAEWQMFDADGRPIASDRRSFGPIVMDGANQLMYLINPAGYLVARKLGDGSQLYNFLPQFGDSYARTFISRQGQRMLIAGSERPRGSHGDFVPANSIIEADDLGERPTVDEMGFLTSLVERGSLMIPSIGLRTAGINDQVIAAVPGRLYLLDANLKIKDTVEAEFTPVAMSLDEAGRIYLVSSVKDRTHLWMLTPAGEQIYSFDLPPGTSVIQPPLVDYDHTAYLIAGQHITAVDHAGKLKWSKSVAGSIAGASVMADDHLLIAEGGTVAIYDTRGERRAIFQSPGEDLATPPVLSAKGEILVASATHLYCLSPIR